MDIVTHMTMGATIGAAVAQKRYGWRALAVGAVCGGFPDLDYASFLFGEWTGLKYHRALLHNLLFLPLWALLLGWVAWRLFKKRGRYWHWAGVAFLAMLAHPLLDWQTAWGTQLFWPITDHRYFTDTVALIDPAVTIWLLAATVLAIIYRHRRRDIAAWSARAALVVVFGYLVGGQANSIYAARQTRHSLPKGFHAVSYRAIPTLGNIWLWRVVARDKKGDIEVGLFSIAHPEPVQWHDVPVPDHALLHRVRQTDRGKLFYWFSDHFVSVSVHDPHFHGHDICLADQRYGGILHPERAMWGACADIKPGGKVADFKYADFHLGRLQVAEHFEAIWHMIWHGAPSEGH